VKQADIRCDGWDGATVLHAIRTETGEWHWSGPSWSGVLRGTRQHIITALADAIGRGEVHRVNAAPSNLSLSIDRLGHTWHDGVYWPPNEWLMEITDEGMPNG
jgi:hypothetical protein